MVSSDTPPGRLAPLPACQAVLRALAAVAAVALAPILAPAYVLLIDPSDSAGPPTWSKPLVWYGACTDGAARLHETGHLGWVPN